MHGNNKLNKLLRNPKAKPHHIDLSWPFTIAADALLEFHRKGTPKPPDTPSYRLYILTDAELEFLARAVDSVMVA